MSYITRLIDVALVYGKLINVREFKAIFHSAASDNATLHVNDTQVVEIVWKYFPPWNHFIHHWKIDKLKIEQHARNAGIEIFGDKKGSFHFTFYQERVWVAFKAYRRTQRNQILKLTAFRCLRFKLKIIRHKKSFFCWVILTWNINNSVRFHMIDVNCARRERARWGKVGISAPTKALLISK